ncbi:MAG: cytochrome c oxidase subunit II [Thiohalophilus sp.]|uniref:cytochrome c oxidase subunit II n=1 Tax=Thiohalophilus sp. TaxID=3028392 RepID=UPI002870AAA3|nr:cytochrome c oxidase subunit II [Thiohalophilus sp.]MDR9435469.1 cytochrome c oxidase subunit II [Thiohalophilus sp.]
MSANTITRKLRSFLYAVLLLGPGSAFAEYGLNMSETVTVVGKEIYGLHMLVLWIVTIVGIGVFGVMIYSLFKHRKSKGAKPAQFHESTTVEVIWTIIPLVVLVLIAIPATKTLIKIEDTSSADVTVKATGWQWKWQYEYLDEGLSFFSNLDSTSNEARQKGSGVDVRTVENYLLDVDKPIVVPVNKKVRILTTSNDVIHAWWVPDLGVKRDAIPGYINESWFKATETGTYRGQCAELCGKDHGFMPIVVKVVAENEYQNWVAEQKEAAAAASAGSDREWTEEELLTRGEEVYKANCAACHQANGQGIPGTFPALVDGPIATGPAEGHIDIVLNGKSGTSMQAFGPQLNDADLAAVITYERKSWGNDASVVQPSAVKAAR